MRGGHKFPMPGSPESLQRTALFREESKAEAAAILARTDESEFGPAVESYFASRLARHANQS
jgi:hypothetical protein